MGVFEAGPEAADSIGVKDLQPDLRLKGGDPEERHREEHMQASLESFLRY